MSAVYRLGPTSFVSYERGRIRSFVDRLSNAISINHGEFLALLTDSAAGAPPLSDESLRALMHELTHHATFAHRVGRAQSALATSVAARASIGVPPDGDWGLWLGARDDLVLRYFLTLFEPLIEGLALFGENDTRWGDSPLISHAFIHTVPIFFARAGLASALRVPEDGPLAFHERLTSGLGSVVNERLHSARTASDWIDAKEYLLQQPISGHPGGPPYLLGYLATKRAFLTLRSRTSFSDCDYFLIAMIRHWFADAEIANLLVRSNDLHLVRVQVTLGQILDRFQDLWESLARSPLEVLRAVVSGMEEDEKKDSVDFFDVQEGVRIAADALNIFVPKFGRHRLVVRLGVLRVDIVTQARSAVINAVNGGARLMDCELVRLGDEGSYPGTIELVRTYDGSETAILVLGPTGLVAVRSLFSTQWNPPELVELFDDLPSIEHVEAAASACRASMFASSWNEGTKKEMNDAIMGEAASNRDHIYLQLAFPGARADRRNAIIERMVHSGFRSIFDQAGELREVARLSLYFGGAGNRLEDVAKELGRASGVLSQRIDALNEKAREALGEAVFVRDGERVTAAV